MKIKKTLIFALFTAQIIRKKNLTIHNSTSDGSVPTDHEFIRISMQSIGSAFDTGSRVRDKIPIFRDN